MSDEPTIEPASLGTRWRLDIQNSMNRESWNPGGLKPRDLSAHFEANLIVDAEAYERVTGAQPAPCYAVRQSFDLNPWHRKAIGRRARAKRLRDGVWWTFRRRILRRTLVESVEITVPNCRISAFGE